MCHVSCHRIAVCHPPSVLADLSLDAAFPSAVPGFAAFVKRGKRRKYLVVRCRTGWLPVDRLSYDKRKVMSSQDFANGFLKHEAEPFFVADDV